MPLYQYLCTDGHLTEVYQHHPEPQESRFCEFPIDEDYFCAEVCELQTSLCTMKPDKHWNGTVTPTGDVVYSQEEYDEVMKNVVPYNRENKEFVEKQAVKRKQEHEEKKAQRRDKFFDKLANEL